MNLTYSENESFLDEKYIDSDLHVGELFPSIFKIVEIDKNLPSFLTVTIDDIRLRTVLSIDPNAQILTSTKHCFLYNPWIYKIGKYFRQ